MDPTERRRELEAAEEEEREEEEEEAGAPATEGAVAEDDSAVRGVASIFRGFVLAAFAVAASGSAPACSSSLITFWVGGGAFFRAAAG